MGSFIGTIVLLKVDRVSWDMTVCARPSIGGRVGFGRTEFSGTAVSAGLAVDVVGDGIVSTRVEWDVAEMEASEMAGFCSINQAAAPKVKIPQVQSIKPSRNNINIDVTPDFIHRFLELENQEWAADTGELKVEGSD
jgi:hypothetical protein